MPYSNVLTGLKIIEDNKWSNFCRISKKFLVNNFSCIRSSSYIKSVFFSCPSPLFSAFCPAVSLSASCLPSCRSASVNYCSVDSCLCFITNNDIYNMVLFSITPVTFPNGIPEDFDPETHGYKLKLK